MGSGEEEGDARLGVRARCGEVGSTSKHKAEEKGKPVDSGSTGFRVYSVTLLFFDR
jgi:hypothetical protein